MSRKKINLSEFAVSRLGVFFRFLEFKLLSFFEVPVDLVRSDTFISVLVQGIICSFLLIHWCVQKNKSLNQGMLML